MMNNSKENLAASTTSLNDKRDEVNREDFVTNQEKTDGKSPSRIPIQTLALPGVVTHKPRAHSSLGSTSSLKIHDTGAKQILTKDTTQFNKEMLVWIDGIRSGHISYIGDVHFSNGEWAGIVLGEPIGKNDGSVYGKRYYICEANHGMEEDRLTLSPFIASTASEPTLQEKLYAINRRKAHNEFSKDELAKIVAQNSLTKTDNSSLDKESAYNSDRNRRPVLRSTSSSLLSLNTIEENTDVSNAADAKNAARLNKLQIEIRQLKQQLIEKDGTIESLKQTNDSMKAEIENLKQIKDSMKSKIENLEQTNSAMKVENDTKLKFQESTILEYEYTRIANEELMSENISVKQINDSMKAEIKNLKQNNDSMKAEIENLKHIKDSLKSKIENLEQMNSAMKVENDTKLKFQQSTILEYEYTQIVNEELMSENMSVKQINNSMKAEIKNLKQNNDSMKAEIKNLKQNNDSMKAEIENLKHNNDEMK